AFLQGAADLAVALDQENPRLVPGPAVAQLTSCFTRGFCTLVIFSAGRFAISKLERRQVLRQAGRMATRKFNDRPFSYHQEIELEIATLTNLGLGLGRVALPEAERAEPGVAEPARSGWVVMVPFCLPGEKIG